MSSTIRAEVKIRHNGKVWTIQSNACHPHDVILPWYRLVPEDRPPPSCYYLQLHQLRRSKGQNISSICYNYKDRPNMKAVFIIANMSQHYLDSSVMSLQSPLSFSIVILPKRHKEEIRAIMADHGMMSDVTATVASLVIGERSTIGEALLPKKLPRTEILMKIARCVIQDMICVSVTDHIEGLTPPNQRLIVTILANVYLIHIEVALYSVLMVKYKRVRGFLSMKCGIFVSNVSLRSYAKFHSEASEVATQDWLKLTTSMLLNSVHFEELILQDFIFYFAFAYSQLSNQTFVPSRDDPLHILILRCVGEILRAPIETIMDAVTLFIARGDVTVDIGGIHTAKSIFDVAGHSFKRLCKHYCNSLKSNLHATLLLGSIAARFYISCKNEKKVDKLWLELIRNNFQNSGICQDDIVSLKKAMDSMMQILRDHPNMMFTWNHLLTIFKNNPPSLVILKDTVSILIPFLVCDDDDTPFRINFLQPLTTGYNLHKQKNVNLTEGLAFVNVVISIINDNNWNFEAYSDILKQWVVKLMNIVDPSNVKSRKELIDWIDDCPNMKHWSQQFVTIFNHQLESKLCDCKNLSPEALYEIALHGTFDKINVIMTYLSKPQNMSRSINNEAIINLLKLANECISSTQNTDCFLTYLKNVQESYRRQNESLLFIFHLFSLDLHDKFQLESGLIEWLSPLYTTADIQRELNNNRWIQFFKHIPLTANSTNFLLGSIIINIKAMESYSDNFIDALSFVFNHHKLTLEEIPSARVRLALNVFFSLSSRVSFDDYHSLNSNLPLLTSFSQSICIIFNVFKKDFEEKASHEFKNISKCTNFHELNEVHKIVSEKFKPFVDMTMSLIKQQVVTFTNLESLLSCFAVFKELHECVNCFYETTEHINADDLLKLRRDFDDCIKNIRSLLVRNPLPESVNIGSHIKDALTKYGIDFPVDLESELQQNVTMSSSDDTIYLTVKGSHVQSHIIVYDCKPHPNCTIPQLHSLLNNLRNFLEPLILRSMDVLAFSTINDSKILERCIDYYWQSSHTIPSSDEDKLSKLNKAVTQATDIVTGIINGSIKMNSISKVLTTDHYIKLNLDDENSLLKAFNKSFCNNDNPVDVSQTLTPLIELYDVHEHILNIQNICRLFNLQGCLADPILTELIDIANDVKNSDVSVEECNAKIKRIKDIFKIETSLISHPCFGLFTFLYSGCPLYGFAKDRKYDSPMGMDTFIQEHRLVTTELLHENYDEELLAVLLNSMQLILLFFNKSSSLNDLWVEINKLGNLSISIRYMGLVNDNIDVIRGWFNRANGEISVDNKIKLQSIINSGTCTFEIKNKSVLFTLNFRLPSEDAFIQTSWSLEKVENFAQDLSFMNFDEHSDLGLLLRWFRKYKTMLLKLYNYYVELIFLGHPRIKVFKAKYFDLLPNNIAWGHLQAECTDCRNLLKEFKTQLTKCREEFPMLSCVSAEKLNSLYDYSMTDYPDIESIIRDIGVIVKLSVASCPILRTCIQKLHAKVNRTECIHPARLIGKFLNDFVNDVSVKDYLSDFIVKNLSNNLATIIKGDLVKFTLITALEYTPMDLIRLVYYIFDESIPMYFQLFRCSKQTTCHDINLFFDRISNFVHVVKFSVLGVNLINNELQQLLLERCCKLRSILSHKADDNFEMLSVYLVEYSPSLFRHVPWISHVSNEKKQLPEFSEVVETYKVGKNFKTFEIVYGLAGSGKTHYIRRRIADHIMKYTKFGVRHQMLSINETFNKKEAIRNLQNLPLVACDVMFHLNINFIWPPEKDVNFKMSFDKTVDDINWFFFDYYVLGYVEVLEESSCYCLTLADGVETSVYVEVPYWNITQHEDDPDALECSFMKFKELFPVFFLLGKSVTAPQEYDVTNLENTQMVCKYLKAYNDRNLDHIMGFKNDPLQITNIVKDIPEDDCRDLIKKTIPSEITHLMISQTLYLRYMERRCHFMESSAYFRFNAGTINPIYDKNNQKIGEWKTRHMRSTVFELMIREVNNFCKKSVTESRFQLIYDDGRFSKCLCTNFDQLPLTIKEKLQKVGIQIPSILNTNLLHDYLSNALGVKMNPETNKIQLVVDKKFVLTRDFAEKMLKIHERKECGMPVMIEGETGVGKTFVLELLSSLWNISWNNQLQWQKQQIKDILIEKLTKLCHNRIESTESNNLKKFLNKLKNNEDISIDDLQVAMNVKDNDKHFYESLQQQIQVNMYDPVLASLELPSNCTFKHSFHELISLIQRKCDSELMADLLYGILYGTLKETFYKISIHSAMTPQEIKDTFRNIQSHAALLQSHYDDYISYMGRRGGSNLVIYKKPIITVFLDEINTSPYPGFIKELIIDGTIDGRSISVSKNIFIVAACNPHRAHSLASTSKDKLELWFNPNYNVQKLSPTLRHIMWDYGQLKEEDELEYIKELFRLTYNDAEKVMINFFSEQIATAQKLIRKYSYDNLISQKLPEIDATLCSESTVSQRDIQRVFRLLGWLEKWFWERYPEDSNLEVKSRALNIALALVYYFRLNDDCRDNFSKQMNVDRLIGELGLPVTFSNALKDEMDWVFENIKFPDGIAPIEALKENIYAIIVCCMTKIPVIIVGPPGSSKTLSFKIVVKNFQEATSNKKICNYSKLFKSLDPHPYQCSHKSTSNEIETVFNRAITRQRTFDESESNSQSVVLLDEAGLPDESLKVLHYYLDNPKVSFVGISNSVLDAAKTNRAVSVFRSKMSRNDLIKLAKYSLYNGQPPNKSHHRVETTTDDVEATIDGFVEVYERMMNTAPYKDYFGLRDFIHFFTYLGREKDDFLSPQSITTSIEQNFNGTPHFDFILKAFLEVVGSKPNLVKRRSTVKILKSCFESKAKDLSLENQTRYKLLIDSSEDQSLIRQLFSIGIFKRSDTRIYSCSRLPGDGESQKVYTTMAVRYSAIQGHTLIIYQAEEIQESFYDLFNLRFTCVGDNFYTNVSIGPLIKPTRVDPHFNCAMILSKSELNKTTKPFLNRFEKFSLSHEVLYKDKLHSCGHFIRNVMSITKEEISSFSKLCEQSSFYGYTNQTLYSLMLSIFPIEDSFDDGNYETVEVAETHEATCQCTTTKATFITTLLKLFQKIRLSFKMGCAEISKLTEYLFDIVTVHELVDVYFLSAKVDEIQEYVKDHIDIVKLDEIAQDTISSRSVVSIDTLAAVFLKELVTVYVFRQLLQLMTPEALVIHSDKLHKYYIQCYLVDQSHFSLTKLIKRHIIQCLPNMKEVKPKCTVKKFLVYTRTSYAIYEITPSDAYTSKSYQDKCQNLFDLKSPPHVYSITCNTNQEKLNQELDTFFNQLRETQVLLLFADMKDIQRDTINHVRLLLEEAEIHSVANTKFSMDKMIFLILHFPPAMFYRHCYPSLFMTGWQHIYMDMIFEESDLCVDMEKWLSVCLFEENYSLKYDNLVSSEMMDDWLGEWLSMISNSIDFQPTDDFPKEFNNKAAMSYWKKLLFNLNTDDVIKRRFNSFWQRDAMIQLSHQAANYAMTYNSTCTLSSTIKATVQSSFKDVVLFLLSVVNQTMAINTLLGDDNRLVLMKQLFVNILNIISLPQSLQEMKLQLISLNFQMKKSDDISPPSPRFPFFLYVFETVESVLNRALSSVIQSIDTEYIQSVEQHLLSANANTGTNDDECELVTAKMVELFNSSEYEYKCIEVSLVAMGSVDGIWDSYVEDAMSKQLDRSLGYYSRQFFTNYLKKINSSTVALKLSHLHYNLRMFWLDASSLSLLRMMDDVDDDSTLPHEFTFPSHTALTQEDNVKLICDLIVDMMYNSLMKMSSSDTTESSQKQRKKLTIVYYRFLNLFSIDTLKNLNNKLKNKWIVLCVVFHIDWLLSISDTTKGAIVTSVEDFSKRFTTFMKDNTTIETTSHQHIQLDLLTATVAAIGFNVTQDFMSFISSDGSPFEMFSILDSILAFYIKYLYEDITDVEAKMMFSIIGTVLNKRHKAVKSLKTNFRYLFMSLLGTPSSSATHDNPLHLFNNKMRAAFGSLIVAASDGNQSLIYKPSYFKYCRSLHPLSSFDSMVNDLCDIYFETSVKKLQAKNHTLLELVQLYSKVVNCIAGVGTRSVKLFIIEKQAVVYMIIAKISSKFLKDERGRSELEDVEVDLNDIIDSNNVVTSKGKSQITGNGLLFLINLLTVCKSERELYTSMTRQFASIYIQDFDCLHPIHHSIINNGHIPGGTNSVPTSPFLLFLQKEYKNGVYNVFTDVSAAVRDVIRTNGLRGEEKLMTLARRNYSEHSRKPQEMTKWSFNMSLFLAIYFEVFVKQSRNTVALVQVLQNKLSQFVDPKYLNCILWLVNPSQSYQSGVHISSYNILREFFVRNERNMTHVQCIMELAAVILGNPEDSCHLYNHIFNHDKIHTDCVPGATVLGRTDSTYMCVVNTSRDFLNYTSRESLTWHSLIFMQWMNYAMLCLSFVIFPTQSRGNHLFHYDKSTNIATCLNKLTTLWNMLMDDYNLSVEDRNDFVFFGIQRLFEKLRYQRFSDLSLDGELQDFIRYEQVFHKEVFNPAWNLVKNTKKFEFFGKSVGEHMREMLSCVPELRIRSSDTLREFMLLILSSSRLHDKSCSLYILYQFILQRPALNVGAELLTNLISLYNWIHNQLSHKVTVSIAKTYSVKMVIESVLRQFFPSIIESKIEEINNTLELYHRYKKLLVDNEEELPLISNAMDFIDFISTEDGNDALFKLIHWIVNRYNNFLQMVLENYFSSHYFDKHTYSSIPILEVNIQTCTFGSSKNHNDIRDIESIILRHCWMDVGIINFAEQQYPEDDTLLNNCVPEIFNLKEIQHQVIQLFILHKQYIKTDGIHILYQFNEAILNKEAPCTLFYTSIYGYEYTFDKLKNHPALTRPLDDTELHELKFIFHSLSYDSLLSVCGGLCLILKMILKNAQELQKDVMAMTVAKFLSEYYGKTAGHDILHNIGIVQQTADHMRSGLTLRQYSYLCELQIAAIAAASSVFHEWVKSGCYDFCHLPNTMKTPLDEAAEEYLRSTFDTKNITLIKDTMHVLFKYEESFCQAPDHTTTKMSDIIEDEKVVKLEIQYYMHLQIEFRRMLQCHLDGVQKDEHDQVITKNLTSNHEQDKLETESIIDPDTPSTNIEPFEYTPSPTASISRQSLDTTNLQVDTEEIRLMKEAAKSMSHEDVAQFLEEEGFTATLEVVLKNEDDGEILYAIVLGENDEEFKELGLEKPIDRLRFCVLFKRQLCGQPSAVADKYGPNELVKFLEEIPRARKYIKKFEEYIIDGEMLLEASDDVFREMGITVIDQNLILRKFRENL